MKNSLKSAELLFVRKRFDEIQPHPKNPRVHDDRQIGKLRHSIRTHGFAKGSIVIQKSTGYILAGHGIVEALKKEGYNGADVVEVDLPDDKAMAFMVADNVIAEQSTWDDPSLQQLITQLSEQNVPSLDFGFDSKDLEDLATRIMAESGGYQPEPQDDEIPEVVEPITQTGDLWTLGKHRVLCGDSTKAEDVARLMDGVKADLCLTDPPYNVQLEYATYEDNKTEDSFIDWLNQFFNLAKESSNSQIVFIGNVNHKLWVKEFNPDYVAIWDKGEGGTTHGKITQYMVFEPIFFHGKFKIKRHTDVFRFVAGGSRVDHPCPKPIALICDLIDNYSEPDNTILDLFLGSGSTLIACQKLNRVCYGMEISPAYVDVICARWGKFTGEQAVRESDGFLFPLQ